jgi:hypothetical protein
MIGTIMDGLGWAGTILIVLAYAKKRDWPIRRLATINILGSLLLGTSLADRSAYSGVALQVVWIVVSLLDWRHAAQIPPTPTPIRDPGSR